MRKAGMYLRLLRFLGAMNIPSGPPSDGGKTRVLGGLWEAPRTGERKPKWHPSDLEYLTDCLDTRRPGPTPVYNLAQKLKQERLVDLSSDPPTAFTQKKKDIGGSALGTAIDANKTPSKKR